MITLLTHVSDRGATVLTIYLNVLPADLKAMKLSCGDLMDEAKECGRMVGLIVRQFGGNTYFTYHREQQLSVEVQLLASLAKPASEVHIDSGSGAVQTCRF